MTSLRQKWTVRWNDGDPVEITTTVRDLIDAVDRVTASSASSNKVAIETSLIHAALVRSPHNVPAYDEWLDQLDLYQEVNTASNGSGPTRKAASPTGRSRSAASQVPTGAAGQAATKSQTPEP